jgi:hypothetical protein
MKRVADRRVVVVQKLLLYKLDANSRFPNPRKPHADDLALLRRVVLLLLKRAVRTKEHEQMKRSRKKKKERKETKGETSTRRASPARREEFPSTRPPMGANS